MAGSGPRRASSASSPSNRSTRSMMIAAPWRFTCRSRRSRSIRRSAHGRRRCEVPYGSGPLDSISPRRTRRASRAGLRPTAVEQLVEGSARMSRWLLSSDPGRLPAAAGGAPQRLVGLALGGARPLGHHDARRSRADRHDSPSARGSPRPRRRSRRPLCVPAGTCERHRTVGRVDLHLDRRGPPATARAADPARGRRRPRGSAECGDEAHAQEEIAGRSAVDAALPLSGQAQDGAVAHAGGMSTSRLRPPSSVMRRLTPAAGRPAVTGNSASTSLPGIVNRTPPVRRRPPPCPRPNSEAKKSLKSPTSSRSAGIAGVVFRHRPPGGGVKSIPLFQFGAERVVLGALVGIAQDLVGLVDLLEPLGGLGRARRPAAGRDGACARAGGRRA